MLSKKVSKHRKMTIFYSVYVCVIKASCTSSEKLTISALVGAFKIYYKICMLKSINNEKNDITQWLSTDT